MYLAQDAVDAQLRGDESRYLLRLPPNLPHKIAVVDKDYFQDLNLEIGNLARPNEIRVEPLSGRRESASDTLEDIIAHWNIRAGLGGGSILWDSIYAALCHQFYVPIWMEMDSYAPPKQHRGEKDPEYVKRVDRYNRNFFPFHHVVDQVRSVAMMEYQAVPTLATRDIEIPYVNLAEYADSYTSDAARSSSDDYSLRVSIVGKEFSAIRFADGTSPSSTNSDYWSKRARVKVVDDGEWITKYIEGMDGEYVELEAATTRNPYRRVSLQVLTAAYEIAQEMERRFRMGHYTLLRDYDLRMMSRSLISSYAASSATAMGLMLDGEAAAKYMGYLGEETEVASIDMSADMPIFPGKVGSYLGMADQIKLEEGRLQEIEADLARNRPISMFNGPDAGAIVEYAKASAVLHASEEQNKRIQGMTNACSRFVRDGSEMMVEAWFCANEHYERGSHDEDPRDIPLSAVLVGTERVFGRVTRRGDSKTLTPAAADFDYELTVTSRDERLSTRAAIRAEAQARWNTIDGVRTITYDQYLADSSGETNISAYKVKLLADQIVQMQAPAMMQGAGEVVTQQVALLVGVDPMRLSIQQDVAVDPNGPAPSSGGANESNGNQRISSPATEMPVGQAT